jgi:phytanoyl-CoA hydroxylase
MLKHASTEYILTDSLGNRVAVPVDARDDFAYFTPGEAEAIRAYYLKYGYVVVRGLVASSAIELANSMFDGEILPSRRFIYRQATANPERNVLTPHGFMLNSILNLQSLDPRHFPRFRDAAQQVLSESWCRACISTEILLPGPTKTPITWTPSTSAP